MMLTQIEIVILSKLLNKKLEHLTRFDAVKAPAVAAVNKLLQQAAVKVY